MITIVNDGQQGGTSNQGENADVNKEIAAMLKKLQSKMEVQQYENESLRKEVTTAKSKTKSTPKKTMKIVAR